MRLYRTLLLLYPSSFRNEYSGEMCAMFADRWQRARGFAALWLWISTAVDVLLNAIKVHWDLLRQDLRYAGRTFSRSPGFALTVILVAALGVGATTAVFTVADHVLLRPLPFPEPDRLLRLWEERPGYQMELSPPNYRDWKSATASFESIGAYRGLSVNLVGEGEPERLEGASLTAEMLPILGVRTLLGRTFSTEDDRDGAPGTAILSYGLWQANFGGDRGVLGKTIHLDGVPYTVIGVMPPRFYFPNRDAEIWTAMRFTPGDFADRNNNYLDVIARLKPGVSVDQAREEMRVIAKRLESQYPKENARTSALVMTLRDTISSRSRLLLGALLAAAICVLLITCTNLANLLLARAIARQKELAVRSSLGAGRERLIRQLLTESMLLAVLGGILGVAAASAAVPLLLNLVPQTMPIAEPSIDLRIMLFSLAFTVLTGIGFGVMPALRATSLAGTGSMREGSREGIGGRKDKLRSMLVVAEVTMSVVLLISAGLLVRALWRIQAIDPGFRSEGVVTLRTSLPMPQYQETARRQQFYDKVLGETRQLPGVTSAAYISFLPMAMRGGIWPVSVGSDVTTREESQTASLRYVTPGFFETMGIPLRQGRDVSESDSRNSLFVAVVSESFVRRYWPGQDPLGRTFKFAFNDRTVVGVVGDISVRGLERRSEPQVYLAYNQVPDKAITWYAPKDLVVRFPGDPSNLVPAVRRIIRSADPGMPISDVRTLSAIVEADTANRKVQVRVLTAFAAAAFLLAALGIHGLLSFMVSQRTQEIGVRMALGAQTRDILSLILGHGLVLAAVGGVLGVALGYLAGRAMEALLAGVTPGDVFTISSAVGLVVAMTVGGSLLPAIRAIRIDPSKAIRAD